MPNTMHHSSVTTLDDPRVIASQPAQERLSSVVIAAARKVYGKQEAAAAHLGKDAGNFSRDVKAGRLPIAQLDELGEAFLAALGKELVEHYGTALEDPKARAKRVCDQMDVLVNEIRQFVDVS